jgi:hypothetical protein
MWLWAFAEAATPNQWRNWRGIGGTPNLRRALHTIKQLVSALPDGWAVAASEELRAQANVAQDSLRSYLHKLPVFPSTPPKSPAANWRGVVGRIGWQVISPGEGLDGKGRLTLMSLQGFTVKGGTHILLEAVDVAQQAVQATFAAEARGESAPPSGSTEEWLAACSMRVVLRQMWRLPLTNVLKESYWLLMANGFATAARLHINQPCPCGAGGESPGREHHYWKCIVAQGVVDAIRTMADASGAPFENPLSQEAIWLAKPPLLLNHAVAAPPKQVHQGIWSVIVLLAVHAMNAGRNRIMWEYRGQPETNGTIAQRAILRARRDLRIALKQFVQYARPPASWRAAFDNSPETCLFFRWPNGARRLTCINLAVLDA